MTKHGTWTKWYPFYLPEAFGFNLFDESIDLVPGLSAALVNINHLYDPPITQRDDFDQLLKINIFVVSKIQRQSFFLYVEGERKLPSSDHIICRDFRPISAGKLSRVVEILLQFGAV